MRNQCLFLMMAAGMGLAACSSERPDTPGFDAVKSVLKPTSAPVVSDSQQVATAVGETMAALKGPIALATFEKTKNNVVLRQIETNGPYRTWASAGSTERRTVSTKNGILTSTRGLRNDLMSSNVDQTLALVSARRSGTAARTQRYLNGENQIYEITASCTVSNAGQTRVQVGEINRNATEMREQCQDGTRSFTNIYRVDSSGRILQSVQWLNDFYGITAIQMLR